MFLKIRAFNVSWEVEKTGITIYYFIGKIFFFRTEAVAMKCTVKKAP